METRCREFFLAVTMKAFVEAHRSANELVVCLMMPLRLCHRIYPFFFVQLTCMCSPGRFDTFGQRPETRQRHAVHHI